MPSSGASTKARHSLNRYGWEWPDCKCLDDEDIALCPAAHDHEEHSDEEESLPVMKTNSKDSAPPWNPNMQQRRSEFDSAKDDNAQVGSTFVCREEADQKRRFATARRVLLWKSSTLVLLFLVIVETFWIWRNCWD